MPLVQDIVQLNPCWGLFVSDSGQLVAWCLTAEYGVGMLRTEEQHRRKGYAQAVASQLFRHLGKGGIDMHLHVEKSNAPAHRLFHELGCLPMGDVYWSELTAQ
ncbi:hypothetical protein PR048_004250 [Dryococelus australis]|uniref:N-acetyltransferase domain-containing protein n=1 Tax=Dryococelus australis TaxID=614101 RepID=A0ABQ9I508_9NEOP|nr:hypothetical protein PR048_004250 [Dryococelus australis]